MSLRRVAGFNPARFESDDSSGDDYEDENRALIGNQTQIQFTGGDTETTIQLLYEAICAIPVKEDKMIDPVTLRTRDPRISANFESHSLSLISEMERQSRIPGDRAVRHIRALLKRYELYNLCLAEIMYHVQENNPDLVPMLQKCVDLHRILFRDGLDFFKQHHAATTAEAEKNNQSGMNGMQIVPLRGAVTDKSGDSDSPPEDDLPPGEARPEVEDGFLMFLTGGDDIKRFTYPWFQKFIPILSWLPEYDKKNLKDDVFAGLTVGGMLISQSMSYALLADLPVEYGLYSSIVPILSYMVFGTSRQLGVGPVAIVSLLTSEAVSCNLEDDVTGDDCVDGVVCDECKVRKIEVALLIAFISGVIQVFMGMCRLGFLIEFLSHPVISGFTSAAAIIIALSQMGSVLGVSVEKAHSAFLTIYHLAEELPEAKWETFLFSCLCIGLLLGIKKVNAAKGWKIPGPLCLTVISILFCYTLRLDEHNVKVVGDIPQGLPSFVTEMGSYMGSRFSEAIFPALAITFVGFLESIAIAKRLAQQHSYSVDNNQEMIALGVANSLGSLFSSYSVSGSFSRSAVLGSIGCKSQISGGVVAVVIMLTALFLTSLFYYLPKAALAAIILTSVVNLIDTDEAKRLYKVSRRDFLSWGTAFLLTLGIGVERGIGISVVISLFLVLWFSVRPPVGRLARVPGTAIYRDVKWHPDCIEVPGGIVLRMDAPLYFLNAAVLERKLAKHVLRIVQTGAPVNYIIIDCRGINDIDTSGVHKLEELHDSYEKQGRLVLFTNITDRMREFLDKCGFIEHVGPQKLHGRVHDGVEHALNLIGESVTRRASVRWAELEGKKSRRQYNYRGSIHRHASRALESDDGNDADNDTTGEIMPGSESACESRPGLSPPVTPSPGASPACLHSSDSSFARQLPASNIPMRRSFSNTRRPRFGDTSPMSSDSEPVMRRAGHRRRKSDEILSATSHQRDISPPPIHPDWYPRGTSNTSEPQRGSPRDQSAGSKGSGASPPSPAGSKAVKSRSPAGAKPRTSPGGAMVRGGGRARRLPKKVSIREVELEPVNKDDSDETN